MIDAIHLWGVSSLLFGTWNSIKSPTKRGGDEYEKTVAASELRAVCLGG